MGKQSVLRAFGKKALSRIKNYIEPSRMVRNDNMSELYNYLLPALPKDSSNQSHSTFVLKSWLSGRKINDVLDLGCGDGRSVDIFRRADPDIKWIGLDIEGSPEVQARKRSDATFVSYDGITFPFEENAFDLVYSHQVFEHVRYPEAVLRETFRTLRPGGMFIGSTSQLEPYHSYSFWNYTVYGFARLLEESGFVLREIRPGIDGPTLIERSRSADRSAYAKFFAEESPLNKEIAESAALRGHRVANFRKLMYCGHFVFRAEKV